MFRLAIQLGAASAALAWSGAASAALTCADIEQFLLDKAQGVVCFATADLRASIPTAPPITPANDTIRFPDGTPVPPFGITSATDPTVISTGYTTPTAVPGIQVSGWFNDDPDQARFLLRFPANWNGRLVVAGASGTRSEFNGDWAWSNYVLPKGYAYASQNKGVLNFRLAGFGAVQPAGEPMACRLNPSSVVWVHFYDNNADKPFTQWTYYMLQTASLAKKAIKVAYERPARRTYAVGTSNGGYQVRRAIEEAPDLFDGGIDWEGTFIDPRGPNLMIELPVAIRNFPLYVASGFDPNSAAAQEMRAAGYPPDIVQGANSLWALNNTAYWEVTMCQWQKRFDPTFVTYTGDTGNLGNYDYAERQSVPGVFSELAAVATTGKIKKPLITLAGTMDALLPIDNHARAYERAVNASRKGNNDRRSAQYRLYEVQNGNHIEGYTDLFPQLRLIQPHAHKAFDLLVDHVENNAPLPPSQCIPKDGTISATPAQAGHCANLLE
jgi:hypothetical protein